MIVNGLGSNISDTVELLVAFSRRQNVTLWSGTSSRNRTLVHMVRFLEISWIEHRIS